MNNITISDHILTIVELVLVLIIIIKQTIEARKTYNKIIVFSDIVPNSEFFKIEKHNIQIEDLQKEEPATILKMLSYNSLQSESVESKLESLEMGDDRANEISLINPNDKSNIIFDSLLHSINVYLLRNKGAIADFNLVKDITERNLDAEEEDIIQSITVPIYLGLMGTMLGIIFGLISLFIASNNGSDFEINGFLLGVAIAMFASMYGLACTVYNSNFKFKEARAKVEKSKNDFYTFIQTELLPILNQSVSSSVSKLHTSLMYFNDKFETNIGRFEGVLNKNYETIIAQDRILETLGKIDVNEYANANINVLIELKKSTEDIHKFNQYLNILNSTVDGTTKLSNSFGDLLSRVNHFEDVANKLDFRLEENNKLVQFFNDHYEHLTKRGKELSNAVRDVDDILVKSLDKLQEHTDEKIKAIKTLTDNEKDLMSRAFADNRSHFSNLALLKDLNDSFKEIKSTFSSKLEDNNKILESIERQITITNKHSDETILSRFKKWVSKRNNE